MFFKTLKKVSEEEFGTDNFKLFSMLLVKYLKQHTILYSAILLSVYKIKQNKTN